jgi:hypothetical protein
VAISGASASGRPPPRRLAGIARYVVTVRRTGATAKSRHETLDAALDALAPEVREAMRTERRGTAKAFLRDVPAVQQVALRAEVAGPGGLRGGVDVRGDGSAEAYTGRWRRTLVEPQRGEDALQALARALRAP